MIISSSFKPAWWLPGPHAQTLFPYLMGRPNKPTLKRERLLLPDGDFLDLDWTKPADGPLVVMLHGLEGSSQSAYASGLLYLLEQQGYQGVLMHFRGCSGEPNLLSRGYHSGETGDLQTVLETLRKRMPGNIPAVVGFSLGGNVLLKWLGESGEQASVSTAVAVSVPFELNKAANRLSRGFSRVYQRMLLKRLRKAVRKKFDRGQSPVTLKQLETLTSFRKFDDQVTAPLHGFAGVDDYYSHASSRQYLGKIRRPTLIIQSLDDPFLTSDAIPANQELANLVTLELTDKGGHAGFVAGQIPLQPHYWLEQRICEHLQNYTNHKTSAV